LLGLKSEKVGFVVVVIGEEEEEEG